MNLIVGAPSWLIAVLVLALLAAAIEDALRFRISNITCAVVFVTAIVAAGIHGLSPSLWQNALICVAILAIGTWAFTAGWMGGGDIKLLAAIGLWLNLSSVAGLLAAVFLAGGLVAIVYIVGRRVVRRDRKSSSRKGRVPYGVAIVVGAFFVFATQLNQRPSNAFVDQIRAKQAAERR